VSCSKKMISRKLTMKITKLEKPFALLYQKPNQGFWLKARAKNKKLFKRLLKEVVKNEGEQD